MQKNRNGIPIMQPTDGYCRRCAKIRYSDRIGAGQVARCHTKYTVYPYRCPHGNGWHLTHHKRKDAS